MGTELRHRYILKFHESEFFLEPGGYSLDEGTEYVAPFKGHVIYRRDDEEPTAEAQRDQVIGRFQGYVIHAARALNDGIDLWDHCDAHSQDICDYVTAFYDEDGGIKEDLEEAFETGGDGHNLLIIDEIALHPDHRGQLLGLRTLRRLLELLGDGCAYAATVPYPLQFREGTLDDFEQHPERNRKRAEQQLALYIDRLGFEPLPNMRIYALSLSQKLPDLEIVGRPANVLSLVLKSQGAEVDPPAP